MFDAGLLEEAKGLIERGMTIDMQSAKGIGYSELISYFNGEISLEEAKEKIKQHSRNYAKRQLTLFRRLDATWIEALPKEEAINKIMEELK